MTGSNVAGITSYGGYVPRLRLSRKAIADANKWFNPSLAGQAVGERSMANWDEDSVTMAVEAARDCLAGTSREAVDALYFASTTMPFSDRQNAAIVATALALREDIPSLDVTSSMRAGSSALLQALTAVQGGAAETALVTAGEHRKTRAGAVQEMRFGDAGAAFTVGTGDTIANLLGSHSLTIDFVDHFRGEGAEIDYSWEERWIRDEGYSKIVPRAIAGALEKSGVGAADIAHFVMPCVFPRLPEKIARGCGIDGEAVHDTLHGVCGEAGTAHSLVMLSHALEQASPGEKILAVSFGQGCDAMVLETTGLLPAVQSARRGISGSLERRRPEENYMKWLAFNGLVDMELGMRAETDNRTPLTVLYRKHDMIEGFIGGKCAECGTLQYPRTRICVNPECKAVDTQQPYSMSEQRGTVQSWSADFLTYSPDPPQHYGMIVFEEGGRLMMDFTDVDPGTIDSGTAVRLAFRIKDFDRRRGFRKYFWKAIPDTGAA
ncbi:MAG TPA: OB-fold domain-containing protein [Gammaproteobacteria bacterium]|nr:OB-fold domain-containing protein [Gammaproteobacteria bacterium]